MFFGYNFLSIYKNRKNIVNMFLECWHDVEKYPRASFLVFIIVGDFDFWALFELFLTFCRSVFYAFEYFFHFGVDFCRSQIKSNFQNRVWHGFLKSDKDFKNPFRMFLRPILRNLLSLHPCQKGVSDHHVIKSIFPFQSSSSSHSSVVVMLFQKFYFDGN